MFRLYCSTPGCPYGLIPNARSFDDGRNHQHLEQLAQHVGVDVRKDDIRCRSTVFVQGVVGPFDRRGHDLGQRSVGNVIERVLIAVAIDRLPNDHCDSSRR